MKQNNKLRQEVEASLEEALKNFVLASSVMKGAYLDELLAIPSQSVKVDIHKENIMSVEVPKMTFQAAEDAEEFHLALSYLNTSSEWDEAVQTLNQIMKPLLELSELEKTCQLMADDIESTRRRVNALEYRVIPDTQETIAFIESKLEESERSTKTRMIKIKDMNH